MSVSPRERNQPTTVELVDLLSMLVAAADEGQLVSVAFMLRSPEGDTMVDYRGNHELSELTARTVLQRIAQDVAGTHPAIAAQITSDLARKAN
ncbi:hypothetical protein [Stenotrophomonas maltophilia]|uniref:hypothetical protein n=1 Tax=Stenotrophomonas maltophilia TaxID=40324 RepID=UPI0015F20346|nr:hypothetical protein [Stenotrophomonas maltophilia]QDY49778.1 hypothetical protein DUW70_15175 [Stenotrophomonas maltophilia]HEL5401744.1 hypothetical protein [Stenotrophomonas maltophilia]